MPFRHTCASSVHTSRRASFRGKEPSTLTPVRNHTPPHKHNRARNKGRRPHVPWGCFPTASPTNRGNGRHDRPISHGHLTVPTLPPHPSTPLFTPPVLQMYAHGPIHTYKHTPRTCYSPLPPGRFVSAISTIIIPASTIIIPASTIIIPASTAIIPAPPIHTSAARLQVRRARGPRNAGHHRRALPCNGRRRQVLNVYYYDYTTTLLYYATILCYYY